jgi:hypothetical protein
MTMYGEFSVPRKPPMGAYGELAISRGEDGVLRIDRADPAILISRELAAQWASGTPGAVPDEVTVRLVAGSPIGTCFVISAAGKTVCYELTAYEPATDCWAAMLISDTVEVSFARSFQDDFGARLVSGTQASDHAPVEMAPGLCCRTCVTWLDDDGGAEFGIADPVLWPCAAATRITSLEQHLAGQPGSGDATPAAGPPEPRGVTIAYRIPRGSVTVAGHDISGHVDALRLAIDRGGLPVLDLRLHPSSVDVTAGEIVVDGEIADMLAGLGWLSPADGASMTAGFRDRITDLEGGAALEAQHRRRLAGLVLLHAPGQFAAAHAGEPAALEAAALDYVRYLETRTSSDPADSQAPGGLTP